MDLTDLDENWACRSAIEQARNNGNGLLGDDLDRHHWLHQWSYSTSRQKNNNSNDNFHSYS